MLDRVPKSLEGFVEGTQLIAGAGYVEWSCKGLLYTDSEGSEYCLQLL